MVISHVITLLSCLVCICWTQSTNWVDYAGFCTSTYYQTSPISNAKVANIAAQFEINLFKFYNGDTINETVYAISQRKPDAKFYIQISNDLVNSLTTSDINKFLLSYESVKSQIEYIQLGNEPMYTGSTYFYNLPTKLQLIYTTLASKSGWSDVKVSIPFSASIMSTSYPVESGAFHEPQNGDIASFSSGSCSNCVDSTDSSGSATVMYEILTILNTYGGSFMINWYPYFTCLYGESSWLDYCLGNSASGGYNMMLEAQFLSTKYAMAALVGWDAVDSIGLIITETGWPTASDGASSITTTTYAQEYYTNLIDLMQDSSSVLYQSKIFFFELFDEYNKYGSAWEKYFGWIGDDGYGKYTLTDAGLTTGYYFGDVVTPSPTDNNDGDVGESDDGDDDGGDTGGDTSDPECDYYYDCLQLMGLSSPLYDFNGYYSPLGCYADKGYYSMSGTNYDGSSFTAYMYESATLGYWHIYTDYVSDSYAYAFCFEDDVYNCGGNWHYWDGGGFTHDSDCVMYDCSGSAYQGLGVGAAEGSILEEDCDTELDYGNKVCVYDENLGGVIQFKNSKACLNDMPYFWYNYKYQNKSEYYYLSFNNSMNSWVISKDNLQNDYYAYCIDTSKDLMKCTYEMWYVRSLGQIEDSMGVYECGNISNSNDNSKFCQSSSTACAKWEFTLEINDLTASEDLCNDFLESCIVEQLFTSHSEATSQLKCHSSTVVEIDTNVTFSSILGSAVYKEHSNDTSKIVMNCFESDDELDLQVTTKENQLISYVLSFCFFTAVLYFEFCLFFVFFVFLRWLCNA